MSTNTRWYQQFNLNGKLTAPVGHMNEGYFNLLRPLFPRNLTKKVVLDLACNAGFVSFKLASLGARVIGFDKSEQAIDQAQYVMSHSSVPKVRFVIMDIEKLEPSFYNPDIIVALSVIYHLKDPESMIGKISATEADIIASFRARNTDEFLWIFDKFNRSPVKEVSYGRKRAFLFKKP